MLVEITNISTLDNKPKQMPSLVESFMSFNRVNICNLVLLMAKIGKHLFYSDQTYCTQNYQKASEYDQEIPQ